MKGSVQWSTIWVQKEPPLWQDWTLNLVIQSLEDLSVKGGCLVYSLIQKTGGAEDQTSDSWIARSAR